MELSLQWDRQKLTNTINALNEVRSGNFLRTADTKEVAESALRYLLRRFPRSKSSGEHLKDNWRVEYTNRRFGFEIKNDLVEHDSKMNKILHQLNYGTPAYTRRGRGEVFFGRYRTQGRDLRGRFTTNRGFVTFALGRQFKYPAREGRKFIEQTIEYTEEVLMPRLARKLRKRLRDKVRNG